jgi:hypothetical protein
MNRTNTFNPNELNVIKILHKLHMLQSNFKFLFLITYSTQINSYNTAAGHITMLSELPLVLLPTHEHKLTFCYIQQH